MPEWIYQIFSLLMGAVVGSFLNVVVVRLPHGDSVAHPGSACPSCKRKIRWFDNIPILSFILLRGKCRNCHRVISLRYPVIELLTAVLFLATEVKFGMGAPLFLRYWPFVAALVAITFIDLEHRIIPDVLSLGGLLLGLGTSWLAPEHWSVSFFGAVLGFGVFYLMALAYEKATGRVGLGGGDIKLLAMLGAFLGPEGVFAAIFISSVLGSLLGIGWALATRKKNVMKQSIPYGPFLVVGALYYLLLGDILWFQFTIPM